MTATTEPAAWSDIERLDEDLVRLIGERIDAARRLAAARARASGCRFAHEDEFATVRRFRDLGPAGVELAVLLLRLSRAGHDIV